MAGSNRSGGFFDGVSVDPVFVKNLNAIIASEVITPPLHGYYSIISSIFFHAIV